MDLFDFNSKISGREGRKSLPLRPAEVSVKIPVYAGYKNELFLLASVFLLSNILSCTGFLQRKTTTEDDSETSTDSDIDQTEKVACAKSGYILGSHASAYCTEDEFIIELGYLYISRKVWKLAYFIDVFVFFLIFG